jgi:hypothetical protein
MDARCKVGRATAEYDLRQAIGGQDVEEYLLARWLGRGEYTETGLRPLKDWLNKRLVTRVYTDHGRNALDTRVTADYEALTNDEMDLSMLDDLAADGIDGEKLRSDFVSTATLYRHSTQCLCVSKSEEPDESGESTWETDKIEYTKGVVETNVRESLRALDNKGRLPRGAEAEIKTNIVVGCPDCSTQVGVERAIERGYICADHTETSTVEQG